MVASTRSEGIAAAAAPAAPFRTRAAARPRLLFTATHVSIFADRLRLGTFSDMGRFHIAAGANPEDMHTHSAPVEFDVPLKDRRAYERACAAFNAVLDEHEAIEVERNARRRARAAGMVALRARPSSCSPSFLASSRRASGRV